MKSLVNLKSLTALALVTGALFSGAASADRGFVQISFGNVDYSRHAPAVTYSTIQNHHRDFDRKWHSERHHPRDFQKTSFSSIDARQDRQMARIADGLRSGSLTPAEAQRLLREQQQIAQMERRYLADGRLDPMEWRRIDRELDEAGRNIREEKHDRQDRW